MTEPPTLRRFVVCMGTSKVICEYNRVGRKPANAWKNASKAGWVVWTRLAAASYGD